MRWLGFLGCFVLMLCIMDMAAGIGAFIDGMSAIVVIAGGVAYSIARGGIRQSRDQALLNFAHGALYWGWLGFLVGAVAIVASLKELGGLGPIVAIACLPVLYGYFANWMIMAFLDHSET